MKSIKTRLMNCILCGILVLGLFTAPILDVYADRTIDEVEDSIDHQKEVIEDINDEIDALEGEQDILLEQMDDGELIYMQQNV